MTRTFVKVCGTTRPQDAELAVDLGAHAVGMVFWPKSPRAVLPAAARAISDAAGEGVLKVGVFVNAGIDVIREVADAAALTGVQLHGNESRAECEALIGHGLTVFKAVGVGEASDGEVPDYGPAVTLLVDAHDPERFGGTGETANWTVAREIAASRQTILAGGLNAANVRLAIRTVRPFGVDVSSGVESSPGVKDPARLRAFFEALHE